MCPGVYMPYKLHKDVTQLFSGTMQQEQHLVWETVRPPMHYMAGGACPTDIVLGYVMLCQ